MTAVGRTWHPEHFCCVFCHRQLTESDDFHEKDGIIVCRSVTQVQLVIGTVLCSVVYQSFAQSYVANHGVYFSRSASVLGCNVFFSCEHFAVPIGDLMSDKFNTRSVRDICLHRRTATSYCRAICVLELLMLKRRILLVPGIVFSTRDIDDLMRDMCNDWC